VYTRCFTLCSVRATVRPYPTCKVNPRRRLQYVILLTFPLDFYKQMRDACSTREAPKADTLILCDDKFIKWYPNDAPDPEHPDSKIEDSCKYPDSISAAASLFSSQTRSVKILEDCGTLMNSRILHAIDRATDFLLHLRLPIVNIGAIRA
jgi:hypothetical protein